MSLTQQAHELAHAINKREVQHADEINKLQNSVCYKMQEDNAVLKTCNAGLVQSLREKDDQIVDLKQRLQGSRMAEIILERDAEITKLKAEVDKAEVNACKLGHAKLTAEARLTAAEECRDNQHAIIENLKEALKQRQDTIDYFSDKSTNQAETIRAYQQATLTSKPSQASKQPFMENDLLKTELANLKCRNAALAAENVGLSQGVVDLRQQLQQAIQQ